MSKEVNNQPTNEPIFSKKEEDIILILKLLENRLDEMKDDVSFSKSMLPGGIKTNLVSDIEKTIENPISQLLSLREKVDGGLQSFSLGLVRAILKRDKELIKSVYRGESFESETVYFIVLNEDTFENRNKILGGLDIYEAVITNSAYPVSFQFIPENITEDLTYTEKIIFEE